MWDVPTYRRACMRACMYACKNTCIYMYDTQMTLLPACLLFIPAYLHTYLCRYTNLGNVTGTLVSEWAEGGNSNAAESKKQKQKNNNYRISHPWRANRSYYVQPAESKAFYCVWCGGATHWGKRKRPCLRGTPRMRMRSGKTKKMDEIYSRTFFPLPNFAWQLPRRGKGGLLEIGDLLTPSILNETW